MKSLGFWMFLAHSYVYHIGFFYIFTMRGSRKNGLAAEARAVAIANDLERTFADMPMAMLSGSKKKMV